MTKEEAIQELRNGKTLTHRCIGAVSQASAVGIALMQC